jgi:CO/xanthine dehydrogenase FAD-binding subunit
VGSYVRPAELDEALAALAAGGRVIVAGGTDYYPARVGRPLDDDVLDITGITALRGIVERDDHWRVGALATWSDLIDAKLPPLFAGLKLAAREVGGVQIQNAGTICGNLCNASPAADGVPNLLALDASVELASAAGTRRLALAEFITGNRKTIRRADEVMTAVRVAKPRDSASSHFLKLGTRKYLVISIVMAGGVIETARDNSVSAARIAVGSCSAVAQRLPALERALIGRPLDARLADAVDVGQLAPLSPIDDMRGTAAYRRDATLTLLRRLLSDLAAGRA